jgi:hypothetical protein
MKKIFFLGNLLVLFFLTNTAFALDIKNPASGLFVGSLGDNSFLGIMMYVIDNILLPVAGVISMLFIIIGGFQYITSRGDEELATAGRKTLTNAIIGLVIVIMSYVIVTVVINALQNKV